MTNKHCINKKTKEVGLCNMYLIYFKAKKFKKEVVLITITKNNTITI